MKKYLEYLDNIYFKKIDREEEKKAEADNNLYNEYDVWEKVEIARHCLIILKSREDGFI